MTFVGIIFFLLFAFSAAVPSYFNVGVLFSIQQQNNLPSSSLEFFGAM
jgi:hypothetical protein